MLEHHVLLFLHLSGVMLLVTGVGASLVCKAAAARSQSAHAVHDLLTTANRAIRVCAMPGLALLIAAGAGLVATSHGAYRMSDPWIAGVLVLLVASSYIGARVHAPRSHAARALATQLAAEDSPSTAELRDLIQRGRRASWLDVALLIAMLALMVFKPTL